MQACECTKELLPSQKNLILVEEGRLHFSLWAFFKMEYACFDLIQQENTII
jgi:hypothetical protein